MFKSILSSFLQWFNLFIRSFLSSVHHQKSDGERNIPEIIRSRGFNCEKHVVTTGDGYQLTVFRVINPRKCLKPILLMHGFGGNCSQFITVADDGYLRNDDKQNATELDNTPAFLLAKRGYDVWVGNLRGTRYGMKHKTLSPDDWRFWDYTLDDLVEQDLKMAIDYILNHTGYRNLGYIGVSLGTTLMFGLLSTHKKYNDIIRPFISLAPCYRLYHTRSVLRYPLQALTTFWHFFPFYKPLVSSRVELFIQRVASRPRIMSKYAAIVFHSFGTLLGGANWSQWDTNRLPVYASHVATASFSMKQVMHSMQYTLRDEPFSKFDHGPAKNMQVYGTVSYSSITLTKFLMKFRNNQNMSRRNLRNMT